MLGLFKKLHSHILAIRIKIYEVHNKILTLFARRYIMYYEFL